MRHDLKTWPEPFQAMLDFRKAFEIRRDDRGFLVGDVLHLREWDPVTDRYTGRSLEAQVSYIFRDLGMGLLQEDVVAMSVDVGDQIWTPQEGTDAKP